jgi:hypothetical protein
VGRSPDRDTSHSSAGWSGNHPATATDGKLGGYHFWYKYYLDDKHDLLPHGSPDPAGLSDDIEFMDFAYRGANAEEGSVVVF